MYGNCGDFDAALSIFNNMKKDVISWNCMISNLVKQGKVPEARKLFLEMKKEGFIPDTYTFTALLPVCQGLSDGIELHQIIIEDNIKLTVSIQNALISMYGRYGDITTASSIFKEMEERNVISWNTMIDVLGNLGFGKKALEVFESMEQSSFIPDEITFVNLLTACSLSLLVDDALKYFELMQLKYFITPGRTHYNCMLAVLNRSNQIQNIEDMIKKMARPWLGSWKTLVSECSKFLEREKEKKLKKQEEAEAAKLNLLVDSFLKNSNPE
jgi:pentatricopeptide repeat protein